MYSESEVMDNYSTDTSSFVDSINFDLIITIVLVILIACGIIAALVARHNGRSVALGFLSGFFFGTFGIMTHMVMGEKDK